MSDDTPISPLRLVLCSHSNALRVAGKMCREGIEVTVTKTDEPLQPWRIVDAFLATMEDTRACA